MATHTVTLQDRILALTTVLASFGLLVVFMATDDLWLSFSTMAVGVLAIFLIHRAKYFKERLFRSFSHTKRQIGIMSAGLILVLPFIFINNTYIIHILTMTWIFVLAAVGLDMQVGATGMVNFAQGSLMGIGGYTSALLAVNFGVSFWIGLPAGIIMAGIWGLILGLPTLKTREYHLSLVTIAFAYISYLLVLNVDWTGGPDGVPGIPKPDLFGLSLGKNTEIIGLTLPGTLIYYYLTLVFVGLGLFVSNRLRHSWVGLTWNAVRDDEIASKCYGINLNKAKLQVFVIGSMYAGASGVLLAHFLSFYSTENMAFSIGLILVCMVILGGMDNLLGVVAGTFLLMLIPEKFRAFQDFRLLFYGVVLVLMLLFRPQGLLPNKVRNYGFKGDLQ